MQQLSGEECVSNLVLDEWFAGELEPQVRARVDHHLASCARCAARRDTFADEHRAFLAAAPDLHALQARAEGRAVAPRRRPARALWAAAAGAALAALALVAVLPPREPPGTRSKGGPKLGVFVKHGAHVARGASGDTVQAGDRLRFTYASERPRYFALLNRDAIDARIYFPAGPHAARIPAGSDVALDFSVELDATPGAEQMVAVFCDSPFLIEPLRAALATSGRIAAAGGCVLDTITLHKAAAE